MAAADTVAGVTSHLAEKKALMSRASMMSWRPSCHKGCL
jgi:hypothetical protein